MVLLLARPLNPKFKAGGFGLGIGSLPSLRLQLSLSLGTDMMCFVQMRRGILCFRSGLAFVVRILLTSLRQRVS